METLFSLGISVFFTPTMRLISSLNQFFPLNISHIILLESDVQTIVSNLRHRDRKSYSDKSVSLLIKKEHEQSERVAKRLNCPLSIYQMTFTDQDVKRIAALINQGE